LNDKISAEMQPEMQYCTDVDVRRDNPF